MTIELTEFEKKPAAGDKLTEGELRFLGILTEGELHFLGISKINESLKASYWVGVNCSSSGSETICVMPKYEQFDPVGIFLDGLPYLGHRKDFHPNKLFRLDVRSGKRVNMPEKLRSTWSLFLIIVFVEELKKLLDRRPKRDYRWQVRNQIGVVRGRIRMQDHIRLNLSRGLPHRISTESLEFDQQTALNQILKEACIHAQQAWSHLNNEARTKPNSLGQSSDTSKKAVDAIAIKLRACNDLIADIERPTTVTPTLIAQARRGLKGHFSGYRPVLDWAVSIIRNEYCKMKVKDQASYKTVPFSLNMNTLFELHVRTVFLSMKNCNWNERFDKRQQVFFPTSKDDALTRLLPEREPDLILQVNEKRLLVECKYQMFWDKTSKPKDWLTKFQDDENDKKGKHEDCWKDDPHFEVPRHGFFQALAYMQIFDCAEGMVVFPSLEESRVLSGQIGVTDPKFPFSFVSIGNDEGATTTVSTKKALNALIPKSTEDPAE